MTIAGTLAVAIAAAATAAARRSPPQARVWVTTPDGSQRLAGQSPAPFDAGTASNRLTITVDPSLRYQPMDGFGAAITDSSASVRSAFPAATRDATMRSIFSPTIGLGMSFLRQPIGSSDFVDGPHYTFDDMSAGRTDYALSHFSIAHDEARILPLLRRERQTAPRWNDFRWAKVSTSPVEPSKSVISCGSFTGCPASIDGRKRWS